MKTLEEIRGIYSTPLLQLVSKAHQIHTDHHDPLDIQLCSLISVKTGGCPENCQYCHQSARYQTGLTAKILTYEEVIEKAKRAIRYGVTRICLGYAWREVRDSPLFEETLKMVEGVQSLGVQVCCTMGMVSAHQAERLKKAGAFAYNHNLDSSREHYAKIIQTRTYDDRLETLQTVAKAGLSVCCGGIVGMGETEEDRLKLLWELSKLTTPPDSIPLNRLEPVKGTPLEKAEPISIWEFVRLIATTRILFPKARVRFSAGRHVLSYVEQTLCFFAGVNSLFLGEVLLTVPNPPFEKDKELFGILGIS